MFFSRSIVENLFFFINSSRSDQIYVLEMEFYDGSAKKTKRAVHEQSIAKYFDENGLLCTKAFHNDLVRFFTSLANSEEKKTIVKYDLLI